MPIGDIHKERAESHLAALRRSHAQVWVLRWIVRSLVEKHDGKDERLAWPTKLDLGIEESSRSRSLKRLEQKGFIARVRPRTEKGKGKTHKIRLMPPGYWAYKQTLDVNLEE